MTRARRDEGSAQQPPEARTPQAVETARLARLLASLAGSDAELRTRARRLAERADAQRFHIAVLGDFKRGKSTLVNALIGRRLLPSGVVPVTTVVTEVHFGSAPGAMVVFADGRSDQAGIDQVATYVSEETNPDNRLGVERVEVMVQTALGAPGVVLVDTPGLGSVHSHQTAAAHVALAESDGAIVVLSADSPLSATEHGLLAELASRGAPIFVVVNKCDHLDATELASVEAYVTAQLEPVTGPETTVYFVSARRALESKAGTGTTVGTGTRAGDRAAEATEEGGGAFPGFAAFERDLNAFVEDDLVGARRLAAAHELERLGARRAIALEIERAADDVDAERLDYQVSAFEAAATEVRRLFAEDRLVLDHAGSEVVRALSRELLESVAKEAERQWPEVRASVETLRGLQLERALDDAVTAAVERGFEPHRHRAERVLDERWADLAQRFTKGTQARVDQLREVASELFSVHLPAVAVPSVSEQRHRFSYHFVRAEGAGSSLLRQIGALAPFAWSRQKMLSAARRRLHSELDKHAGRAQHDLAQRLDEAKRDFLAVMAAELDDIERSIVDAAHAARSQRDLGTEDRESRESRRLQTFSVLGRIERFSGDAEALGGRGALGPGHGEGNNVHEVLGADVAR